jgi:hypothetical protein
MNKKLLIFLLITISVVSVSLNLFKKSSVPACINADEAAYAYNAYSILKTGKDEYGTRFPLRLKSFGDYKMPLYAYLTAPIVGIMGLNDISIRMLNTILTGIFPIIVFFLIKEFFEKNEIAILSSLLISTSLGLQIIARQAHEAYLAAVLISLSLLFFVKILKKVSVHNVFFFGLSLTLSLFSYQSSRIFAVFFLVYYLFHCFVNKKVSKLFLITITTIGIIFGITDLIYKPERVKNLLFINNEGFQSKVHELRIEGGSRLLYNKLTIGVKNILNEHIKYFSPQFLTVEGDGNTRFGFPDMSPVTYIEYIFAIIGLYYLFKNREKLRYLILSLLIISPLSASLTWVDISLSRALFILVLVLILGAYGVVNLMGNFKNKRYFLALIVGVFIVEGTMLFYSWDFYFNHYPKRAVVVRNWQCGYKELADYVSRNYNKFDKFHITQRNGQPYIFLLYYMQYPPEKYQPQANLSAPDKYGFGKIKYFDKFIFDFPPSKNQENSSIIGFPGDFENLKDKTLRIEHSKKIKIGTEQMFWIYENPRNR